jgi:hypothetical protein
MYPGRNKADTASLQRPVLTRVARQTQIPIGSQKTSRRRRRSPRAVKRAAMTRSLPRRAGRRLWVCRAGKRNWREEKGGRREGGREGRREGGLRMVSWG